MKYFKTYLLVLPLLMAGLLIYSCSDTDIAAPKQAGLTEHKFTPAEADANNAKLALLPEGALNPTSTRGTITYLATYCGDFTVTADYAYADNLGTPDTWDYYAFYANAGDVLTVTGARTTCGMDLSTTLYAGVSDDNTGVGFASSSNPELTYLGFFDDQIDHACCYGDPFGVVVAPVSGYYTMAVQNYISCGAPFGYTMSISGSSGGDGDADGVCAPDDNCPSDYNPGQENCDGDSEGDVCDADDDNDGVLDGSDAYPCSNTDATVNIDGCDSTVDNYVFPDGSTMMDLILECEANAGNHGDFVSCVSHLTNEWKRAGLITGAQKGMIMDCAAGASIP